MRFCFVFVLFLNIHRNGVLTTPAWLVPHETAAVSAQVLCTPYNHVPCHFMQSHIRKVYACLVVTCHLHFWQNDRGLLRATAITRGWNGYRNFCCCLYIDTRFEPLGSTKPIYIVFVHLYTHCFCSLNPSCFCLCLLRFVLVCLSACLCQLQKLRVALCLCLSLSLSFCGRYQQTFVLIFHR